MYETPFHQQPLVQKHFLVTGGAGFIGSNLVEYLLRYGAGKVRILDNLSTGDYRNIEAFVGLPEVEWIEGDITDAAICLKAAEGINIVLHQAALGSVPRSINNPIATNAANVSGFLNVLVAAKEQGVQRVVYAASSSIYGDSPLLPKTEEVIGRPLSPYALSKYINELYAEVFGRVYGLESIGLRYFNVYGPRQSPAGAYAAVIPRFIQAALAGQSPEIHGDGEQTRDFTFIENVVQANIKAALTDNKEALQQVYNVACGASISLNQLWQMLQEATQGTQKAQYVAARQGDVRHSLADISKAKQFLGYQAHIEMREGLLRTLDWFQNSHFFKS